MSDEQDNGTASQGDPRISIGRIPLKKVRVTKKAVQQNPMNLLVPYLDLFARLDDEELSRLAGATQEIAAELRKQVVTIDEALGPYADLLPRLGDEELVRLTGATPKTVRFWRLCQPRFPLPKESGSVRDGGVVARAASAKATTGPLPSAEPASNEPSRTSQTMIQEPAERTPSAPLSTQPTPTPTPRPPQAKQKRSTQEVVSRLMTFSGDPFPGFDDSAVGFEGVPSPDEADIALQELEDP